MKNVIYLGYDDGRRKLRFGFVRSNIRWRQVKKILKVKKEQIIMDYEYYEKLAVHPERSENVEMRMVRV